MNIHNVADELQTALRAGPFHAALRAAVEARGLTLERLRHRLAQRGLQVAVSTLSYWQQGLRRPERPESLRAVLALEEILELPPRSLIQLLGPPKPRGRAPGVAYSTLLRPARALADILDELGAVADDRRLHILGMYESVRIGPDRSTAARETLQVVQAHEDGADRYIMIYQGDAGCDVALVTIRAVQDCRVGRIRRDAPAGLIVAELLFDRVLRVGDTHVMRYEISDLSGVEAHDYERGFRHPAGQYVLRVAFDPDELPVRIHRFARRGPALGELAATELTLNTHHAVHLAAATLHPGLIGIRWSWP
ncbi:hypothetical protein Skr01_23710 [Sphaerisporangium krabiense]|uniref:hypothetical protein n=1 Tax=Sphaerisporangium krabiense TaxID=763782 RepID=UPI00194E6384|nr:hypothetical protein [Sphaerisporangium krabiense]GII62286.1 hypothetical protein Skr01_23710 [Sphaerisporangium krabiense]